MTFPLFFILLLTASTCIAGDGRADHSPIYSNKFNMYTYDVQGIVNTKNNQASGLAVDIIKKVINKAKIKASIQAIPIKRAMHLASSQKNACIFPIYRLEKRENSFLWAMYFSQGNSRFWSLKPKQKIEKSQLNQFRYVVTQNSYDQEFLQKKLSLDQVITVKNLHRGIRLLVSERSDFLFSPDVFIGKLLSSSNQINLYPVTAEYLSLEIWLACNGETNSKLVGILHQSFLQLIKNNSIKEVWATHGLEQYYEELYGQDGEIWEQYYELHSGKSATN